MEDAKISGVEFLLIDDGMTVSNAREQHTAFLLVMTLARLFKSLAKIDQLQ